MHIKKYYSTRDSRPYTILRDLRHRVSDRLPLVLELKFLIPPTRQPSNANRGHTRRNLEHTIYSSREGKNKQSL